MYIYCISVGGLGPSHACYLVAGSVSASSYEPRLVVCRFSCGILDLFDSFNPSSPSFTRFFKLRLMFDCWSLHLLSLAGG